MLGRKGAIVVALLLAGASKAFLGDSWASALALVPLVGALVYALWNGPRPRAFSAMQSAGAARALAGDEVALSFEIRGAAGARRGLFQALPELPRAARLCGPPGGALFRSGPDATFRGESRVAFEERGRHTLRGVHVRWRGAFGLWEQDALLAAPVTVTVFPAPEGGGTLLRRPRARYTTGTFKVGRVGAGEEFFGLRRHLPGDPIDIVNWKKTARLGRPVVNEYQREVPADVVLMLDAREETIAGTGRWSTLEASIRAAVALSEEAAAKGFRVGLIVLGAEPSWIRPAAGLRQHERILEALVGLQPTAHAPAHEMVSALPPTSLPAWAHVVLVSPLHSDETFPEALAALATRRVREILVVSPSPESAQIASGEAGPWATSAERILRLQRDRFVMRLVEAGATVLDWDVREPLAQAKFVTGIQPARGASS